MEIYIFAVIQLFIVGIISLNADLKPIRKVVSFIYFVAVLYIIFLVGFRWDMGTDWDAYYSIYSFFDKFSLSLPMEKGFLLLNKYFKDIGSSYQLFIFCQSFFSFFFISKFYQKITEFSAVSLLWFFTTNLGLIGANRQFIALGLICLGLIFYYQKKKWYYFIPFVLFATQFHMSSLLAIMYLFFDRRISEKIIFVTLILSVIIGAADIFKFLSPYVSFFGDTAINKANAYSSDISEYSYTAIIKRFIILLPFLIFRKHFFNLKYYDIILNSYVFGICLYLVFGKSLGILATRGAFYFNLMEPVIIASYIFIMRNFVLKNIYVLTISILSFFLMKNSIKQYPQIFVPYKTQFFETDVIKY